MIVAFGCGIAVAATLDLIAEAVLRIWLLWRDACKP
jgi:hypothetical protein